MAEVKAPASEIGCIQRAVTCCCCCLAIKERDTAPDWMVQQTTSDAPSLLQRLLFCQCAPRDRTLSGIEKVPELAGLAGIMVQNGDHSTKGSLQTLKWGGPYNPETRTMDLPVFGGFYGPSTTGLWTEPTVPLCTSALWCCLTNLGRVANYTYRFRFTEDYKESTIGIRCNPCVVCCCCFPCIPAWFEAPACCLGTMMMKQAQDSKDGTSWERYQIPRGQTEPGKKYYDLHQVWTSDGTPGQFFPESLAVTSQQVMVTY